MGYNANVCYEKEYLKLNISFRIFQGGGVKAMYEKKATGWLKHVDFMSIDIVCLELSFLLAFYIRQGGGNPFTSIYYRSMFFILAFAQIFVTLFFDTFQGVIKRGYYLEFTAVFRHVILITGLSALFLVVTQSSEEYSRTIFILTAVFYAVTTYAARNWWKHVLARRREDGVGTQSLLIVSSKAYLNKVVEQLTSNNYAGYHIAGIAVVDAQWKGSTIQGIPVVADASDMAEYSCREWIDEVFLCLPLEDEETEKIQEQFLTMGITVHLVVAGGHTKLNNKQSVEQIGGYTVISSSLNMTTKKQLLLKRMIDICAGLTGCLMTVLLTAIVGPMIYLKSPGPIFFAQERIGKNGKRFKMYKFRSMYMDAEERKKELMKQNRVQDGLMFKMENDPRIIGSEKGPGKGIGNFIRKTSIDEFPQFWNVLKGEMSLVGTRPPTIDEWVKYDLHHRARLAVKPGITGMWQVSGRSEITNFDDVVQLDVSYIDGWNLFRDVKIIFQTVYCVLRKRGAC